MSVDAKKDNSTVTSAGERKGVLISGIVMRAAATQIDPRGTMCEAYDTRWGVVEAPLVAVSLYTIRPGWAKGWVVHREQDDRNFLAQGRVRWILYDDRSRSPTYQKISEVHVSDYNRMLLIIPKGVFHAVQNIGEEEAVIVDMPTVPYNHENPDKYRLPLQNDVIPYRFAEDVRGW